MRGSQGVYACLPSTAQRIDECHSAKQFPLWHARADTMAFDAYGSRMSALALVSNDPGQAWRKEFEALAGFPTG